MKKALFFVVGLFMLQAGTALASGVGDGHEADIDFPPSLASYNDSHLQGIGDRLSHRAQVAPFNLAATMIFLCAIVHTFLTSKFLEISHKWAHGHQEKVKRGEKPKEVNPEKAEKELDWSLNVENILNHLN